MADSKDEHKKLKKELKRKKEQFHNLRERKKNVLNSRKEKIISEKEMKLINKTHELEKEREELREKRDEVKEELDKTKEKVSEFYDRKIEKVEKESENKEKNIIDTAEKKIEEAEKQHEEDIKKARKQLISLEKRVYSRRRRITNAIQFVFFIYLFLAGVVFLKDGVGGFSSDMVGYIAQNTSNPLYGFGAGWLGSIIAQSASLVAILANTLAGNEVITSFALIFVLLGLLIGNSSTPLIVSLFTKSKARWDLRHGFELGVANIIYNFCLIAIGLIIELGFHGFSRLDQTIAEAMGNTQIFFNLPNLLDVITVPIQRFIDFAGFGGNTGVAFLLGVIFLIVSLSKLGKNVFVFLGGRKYVRSIIEKHLSNYWKAFFIGLGLTIIIPSSSLLVSLLVPLAIARIVTLRQAIPFIIGTNVGTFIDVLLAAFATGTPHAISGALVLTVISALGVLFIIKGAGINLIYKTTRYLTIHVLHKKKRTIVKVLLGFTIAPILIILAGYFFF
jgi:sodium-dependent phosphate cotransporter